MTYCVRSRAVPSQAHKRSSFSLPWLAASPLARRQPEKVLGQFLGMPGLQGPTPGVPWRDRYLENQKGLGLGQPAGTQLTAGTH